MAIAPSHITSPHTASRAGLNHAPLFCSISLFLEISARPLNIFLLSLENNHCQSIDSWEPRPRGSAPRGGCGTPIYLPLEYTTQPLSSASASALSAGLDRICASFSFTKTWRPGRRRHPLCLPGPQGGRALTNACHADELVHISRRHLKGLYESHES